MDANIQVNAVVLKRRFFLSFKRLVCYLNFSVLLMRNKSNIWTAEDKITK